jgi:hypothetical protein
MVVRWAPVPSPQSLAQLEPEPEPVLVLVLVLVLALALALVLVLVLMLGPLQSSVLQVPALVLAPVLESARVQAALPPIPSAAFLDRQSHGRCCPADDRMPHHRPSRHPTSHTCVRVEE